MLVAKKILTLHPQGKNGVNISRIKYNIIKDCILKIIKENNIISYQEMNDQVINELADTFNGKVAWYVVTVKLDLEARRIIERIPKTSPHELRLVINN